MMSQRRYMADPDIVCRQEADHAILFNPDTSTMQGINAVGYLIWQALARPRTPLEIVAHLVATCEDVPAEQVGDDVEAFLQALRPGGFVGQVLDGDEQFYGAPPASPEPPVEIALSHAADDEDRASFYHGNSMLGTFRPGDRLIAEAVSITAIRPGDVVVYLGREELGQPERIVHRVVAVTPGGLVTQGDNSPYVDAEPVHPDTLLSRVTYVERDGRVRRVWGGQWGLRRVRMRWARRRLVARAMALGRRPYRWLRSSGLVSRSWQPTIVRVCVETEGDPVVKHLHRGRTVAWWWPVSGRFSCRKPYDLVIPRPAGGILSNEAARQERDRTVIPEHLV